jgi:hypothetical protein
MNVTNVNLQTGYIYTTEKCNTNRIHLHNRNVVMEVVVVVVVVMVVMMLTE